MARARARARRELGVQVEYIEPTEGADRESALRSLAARGVDLVIGVGFIFGPDLERLARAVPEREVRGHRLLAVAGRRDAAEPRGAAVSRARGQLRRRRDRRAADAHEDRRVRRRHEDPADPQVRGGLHRGRALRVPDVPRAVARTPAPSRRRSRIRRSGRSWRRRSTGRAPTSSFMRRARPATACSRRRGSAGRARSASTAISSSAAPCCVVTSMVKRVDVAVVDVIKDVIAQRVPRRAARARARRARRDVRRRRAQPRSCCRSTSCSARRRSRDEIVAGKIEVPDRVIARELSTSGTARAGAARRDARGRARARVHALVGENGAGK